MARRKVDRTPDGEHRRKGGGGAAWRHTPSRWHARTYRGELPWPGPNANLHVLGHGGHGQVRGGTAVCGARWRRAAHARALRPRVTS